METTNGEARMLRIPVGLLLGVVMMAGCWWPQVAAGADESVGQQRLAYQQLVLLRSLSRPGVSYGEYRQAVVRTRQYVALLRGDSPGVALLREAMATYERALHVWSLKEESQYLVDSLRTDQSEGGAILGLCPGISRFRYKFREQIFVTDAVNCVWGKAALLLEQVPEDVR